MKPQLLLLCAATIMLTAQDAFAAKCSFRADTNDFFSGVPTTRTAWKTLNVNGCPDKCGATGEFSMVSENGVHRIEFDVLDVDKSIFVFMPSQAVLDTVISIPVSATLEFTLADGSIIDLPIMEAGDARIEVMYPYEAGKDNYFVGFGARLRFTLDANAVQALGAQKASSVRILGANQSLNIPLDRKSQSHFKDSAACLIGGAS